MSSVIQFPSNKKQHEPQQVSGRVCPQCGGPLYRMPGDPDGWATCPACNQSGPISTANLPE